jgi:hypothetical protein
MSVQEHAQASAAAAASFKSASNNRPSPIQALQRAAPPKSGELDARSFAPPKSLSSPRCPNNPPASRKSFILCSLVSNLCLSKFADYFRPPAHTHCMSLSSGLLRGGRTCTDPVARSVVGHVHAQFVKNVSGSKCQRIARPVPTASPRLTTHGSRSTTHNSRSTKNCAPIHFFTPSLFHFFTHSPTPSLPRSLAPSFPVFLVPEP